MVDPKCFFFLLMCLQAYAFSTAFGAVALPAWQKQDAVAHSSEAYFLHGLLCFKI